MAFNRNVVTFKDRDRPVKPWQYRPPIFISSKRTWLIPRKWHIKKAVGISAN